MSTQTSATKLPTHETPPAEAALAYAKLGWPVFPVDPKTKRPLIKDWPMIAMTNPKSIATFWKKHPNAAVGMVCGKRSGIAVVDVDVKNDAPGLQTLRELIREYGDYRSGLRVRTPSGGLHFYYPHDQLPFSSNAGRIGDGIDLRSSQANGKGVGFVILPSAAKVQGGFYKWVRTGLEQLGDAKVPQEVAELAAFIESDFKFLNKHSLWNDVTGNKAMRKDWIANITAERDRHRAERVKSDDLEVVSDVLEIPYVSHSIDYELTTIAAARIGTQEATFNKAAYSMGTLLGADQLDTTESDIEWVVDELVKAGMQMEVGGDPWTEEELDWKARRAIEQGMGEPRDLEGVSLKPDRGSTWEYDDGDCDSEDPIESIYRFLEQPEHKALTAHLQQRRQAAPVPSDAEQTPERSELTQESQVSEEVPSPVKLEKRTQQADSGDSDSVSEAPSKSGASSVGGALQLVRASDVQIERTSWLWPDMIAFGKCNLIYGRGGESKSTLVYELAARLSRGESGPSVSVECGVTSPMASILLTNEDGMSDTILPRLMAAGANADLVFQLQGVRVRDKETKKKRVKAVDISEDLDIVRDQVKALRKDGIKVGMLCVDPVSAYLGSGKDSNNNGDIQTILSSLSRFAEDTGIAVILVNHVSKGAASAATAAIGSQGFVSGVRMALAIGMDPNEIDEDGTPDPLAKVITVTKANIAKTGTTYAYRIDPTQVEDMTGTRVRATRIEWEGEIDPVDANVVLGIANGNGNKSRGPQGDQGRAAQIWLEKFLRQGFAYPVGEIIKHGQKQGFTKRTLQRAADQLGIERIKKSEGRPAAWRLAKTEVDT